jgi:hypothetical protein
MLAFDIGHEPYQLEGALLGRNENQEVPQPCRLLCDLACLEFNHCQAEHLVPSGYALQRSRFAAAT